MRKPTVHLNGTSRDALVKPLEEALTALYSARKALAQTSPNARDYYTQKGEAFSEAAKEHLERDRKLSVVQGELEEIVDSLVNYER